MDLLKEKTDQELLESVLAEVAKATNELRCSIGDVQKAQSRLSFVLALVNTLMQRIDDAASKNQI